MADFDYEIASPLIAEIASARDTLRGAGEQMVAAIKNSACVTTISPNYVENALTDLLASIETLADYFETLAPQ